MVAVYMLIAMYGDDATLRVDASLYAEQKVNIYLQSWAKVQFIFLQ